MAVWSAIRLQPNRERLALNELAQNGYTTYAPRILRRTRSPTGKKFDQFPLLFPGYVFVLIVSQWWSARYAPGVIDFILDGERPARVPDNVIDELRSHERNGVMQLPKAPHHDPREVFQVNDRLRIQTGPMRGLFGLYFGQAPKDRIKVLMQLFDSERPVEFAVGDESRVHT